MSLSNNNIISNENTNNNNIETINNTTTNNNNLMNSNQNNPNQDADIQKTENTLKIQKKIGNYILLDTIGKGTFSKVTLGYHIQTNQTVAIKILEKDKIQDKIDIERINREITILKLLYHPNISQLYETLSTSHNFYIMMEYIDGGDLFEYISTNNFLSEQKSCKYFRQLISAIEYLNKLGIAHRDIKPENILLNSSKTTLKLIDFGLSNFCGKDEMLNSSCGSPCYASPEMISGYPYYGLISDIWSCGIVLYCMLIGSLPFDDENLKILYDQITEGKFYVPSTLSNEAIDLLKKLLCVNPQKRITLNEIKNHVWFNMDKSVLYKGIFLKEKKINVDFNVVHKIKEKFFKEDVNVTENTLAQIVRNNGCNKYSATYHLYLKMYNKKLQEDEKNLNKNNTGILEIKFKKKRDNNNIFSNNVNNNNYDKKLNVVVINNIISNSSSIKNIKKKIKIKNNKNNKIQTQTTNNNNNTRNNTTNNNNSTPHSNNKVNNYTKKKKGTNLKLDILTDTLRHNKKKTKIKSYSPVNRRFKSNNNTKNSIINNKSFNSTYFNNNNNNNNRYHNFYLNNNNNNKNNKNIKNFNNNNNNNSNVMKSYLNFTLTSNNYTRNVSKIFEQNSLNSKDNFLKRDFSNPLYYNKFKNKNIKTDIISSDYEYVKKIFNKKKTRNLSLNNNNNNTSNNNNNINNNINIIFSKKNKNKFNNNNNIINSNNYNFISNNNNNININNNNNNFSNINYRTYNKYLSTDIVNNKKVIIQPNNNNKEKKKKEILDKLFLP